MPSRTKSRTWICFSLGLGLVAASLRAAETLREAASNRLLVGCAVTAADLQNPRLATLVTDQFSCLTPENEMMPAKLVDDAGRFHFEAADQVVTFAETHHLPVYGHMLVWHFLARRWLFAQPDGTPLPRAKALENLEWYIGMVVGHYRGRVKAWNVVNEAISDRDGEFLRDTPAHRAIGDDYLEKAFAFAHAADPAAELYYNDYNLEQPAKLEKMLRLLRELQARGTPISAVGMQGHWLLDWPPPETIGRGIDALAAAGVKVMVTELDVDPLPRTDSGADMTVTEKGADPYPDGLPPEVQARLAKRYGEIVATIARRPAVTLLGFWGTHDGRSWLNDFPVRGRTNHPLLFDRNLRPKPTFEAVLETLRRVNDP